MTADNRKLGCRGCGSGLEYSATDQTSKCPYCGTVTEIPAQPTCEHCGGALEYEPDTQSLKCAYCDSQVSLISVEDDLPVEADKIIPLTVDTRSLRAAVEDYMISGQFTPDDLIEKGHISKLEMMYEPAYRFSGSFEANWTATFGYTRVEHY